MSAIDHIKAAVDEWNNGLDGGDIERMIATCDPKTVTVNNRQPITVGTQAIRDKYLPRIAEADIKSGFDYEHIEVYGDVAIVVGHFTGEMKNKTSGDVRTAEGRLVLVYRRIEGGCWRMILDMDNNAS